MDKEAERMHIIHSNLVNIVSKAYQGKHSSIIKLQADYFTDIHRSAAGALDAFIKSEAWEKCLGGKNE